MINSGKRILCFTQEEKQRIESLGIMVIEFKRRFYKIADIVREAVRKFIDTTKEAFRAFFDEATDVLKKIAELSEQVKELVKMLIPSSYMGKHNPVYKYMKCNKPYTGVRRIDIRCRSRC